MHLMSQIFVQLRKLALVLALVLTLASCGSAVRYGHSTPRSGSGSGSGGSKSGPTIDTPVASGSSRGVASYYGAKFHGRLTANGERFDQNAMTAAHRSLPFGTKVRVKHVRNSKEVVVRINDRGPFVDGRIIDLSRAAAEQLGMLTEGIATVDITVVH